MSKILISLDIPATPPYTVFFREAGDTNFTVLRDNLQEEDFPFFHKKIGGNDIQPGTKIEYIIGDSILDDPLDLKQQNEEEFNRLLFSCVAKPEPELEVLNESQEFVTIGLKEETTPPYKLGRDETVLLSLDAEFPFKDEGLDPDTEFVYSVTDNFLQMDSVTAKTLELAKAELEIETLSADNITSESARISGRVVTAVDIQAVDTFKLWGQAGSPEANEEDLRVINNPQPGDEFSAILDTRNFFIREEVNTDAPLPTSSIAINPNSGFVATGEPRDHQVRIFDSSFNLDRVLTESADNVTSLDFNPNDGRLASGDGNGNVRVFDSNFNKTDVIDVVEVGDNQEFKRRIGDVAWDPNTNRIATSIASRDDTVDAVYIIDGSPGSLSVVNSLSEVNDDQGGQAPFALEWDSVTGRLFAGTAFQNGVTNDGKLAVWDDSFNLIESATASVSGFWDAAWNEDDGRLAVGTDNQEIWIYEVSGSGINRTDVININSQFGFGNGRVEGIDWDERQNLLFASMEDGTIRSYDSDSLSELQVIENPLVDPNISEPERLRDLDFSGDLKTLVAGSSSPNFLALQYEGQLDDGTQFEHFARGSATTKSITDDGNVLSFQTLENLVAKTDGFSQDLVLEPTSGINRFGFSVTLEGSMAEINNSLSEGTGVDVEYEFDDEDFVTNNTNPDIVRSAGTLFTPGSAPDETLGRATKDSSISITGSGPQTQVARDPDTGRVAVVNGNESIVVFDSNLNQIAELTEPSTTSGTELFVSWSGSDDRLAVAAEDSDIASSAFSNFNDVIWIYDSSLNIEGRTVDFGVPSNIFSLNWESDTARMVVGGPSSFFVSDPIPNPVNDPDNFGNFTEFGGGFSNETRSLEWEFSTDRLFVGTAAEFDDAGQVRVYTGLSGGSFDDTVEDTIPEPAHDIKWNVGEDKLAVAGGPVGVVKIFDSSLTEIDSLSRVKDGRIENPIGPEGSNIYVIGESATGTSRLAKLRPDGSEVWRNDAFDDDILAVDYEGNVFTASTVVGDEVMKTKPDGSVVSDTVFDTESVAFTDLETDSSGDLVVAGEAFLDRTSSRFPGENARGFAKFDGDTGNTIWFDEPFSPIVGTDNSSQPVGLAVDTDLEGNVYGVIRFIIPSSLLTSDLGTEIIKYDPDGNEIWRHFYTRANLTTDNATIKVVNGNVYTGEADVSGFERPRVHKVDAETGRGLEVFDIRNDTSFTDAEAVKEMSSDRAGNIYIVVSSVTGDPGDQRMFRITPDDNIEDFFEFADDMGGIRSDFDGDIIYIFRGNGDVAKVGPETSQEWRVDFIDDVNDVINVDVAVDKRHTVDKVAWSSELGWLAVPTSRGKVSDSLYAETLERIQDIEPPQLGSSIGDVFWDPTTAFDEAGVKFVTAVYDESVLEEHAGPVILRENKDYFFRIVAEGTTDGGTTISDTGDLVNINIDSP